MHQQIFVNLAVQDLPCPPQEHGFMYGHGFEGLDGHVWELSYLPAPPEA